MTGDDNVKGGVTRPTSETRMYVKHWHASIMATFRKQTNGRSRQINHSDPLPMLLEFRCTRLEFY